ncbi:MAG: hypothetical protein JKX85_01860 [Phycisphaeraceae bacterium]|nr:hypothetical protein [Phycisphaeraceae bacterium]
MNWKCFALLSLVACLLVLTGCESLDAFSAKWTDGTAKTVQTVGNVAAPFTGGISSLIAGLAVTILPTVFAVNRQMLKWKADKATAVALENAAQSQAATANIVQTIDVAKSVSATAGVVNFNDPATIKIINTLMTDAAKAAVDAAQNKAA